MRDKKLEQITLETDVDRKSRLQYPIVVKAIEDCVASDPLQRSDEQD